MKFQKITLKSCARLYSFGVRKNKNDKFDVEIRHPICKKKIWLDTFTTFDEASESYKSKKLEFAKLVITKMQNQEKIKEEIENETDEELFKET
ncbi:hypothetical protein H5410_025334 [Solanum commersonii]|uniref:AP2/ERF domain-containing protein n=1 Tax=Solanum commersonii TaxID=4109 RepID=A0A9J5YTY9_SOLCO|nr:hypothetical protein H5410_025334 [Solanum commersonii]